MSPGLTVGLFSGAALAAGVVDSIGGGGGLITLPVMLAMGVPHHAAIATNKGQATFGALASAASYWRGGSVDRARAPLAFAFGFLGSCAGALLLLAMPPDPLKPIVIVLLIAASMAVVLRRNVHPKPHALKWPRLALTAITLGCGLYDGFFGPGTGSLLIIAFVLVFGDAMTRASGNAKIVNLASNVAALAIFAYTGAIDWRLAVPMGIANMIGATIGARLAMWRGDRFVRWVMVAVVVCVVVKLSVDLLTV